MEDFTALPFVVAIPVYLLIGYTIVDVVRRVDLGGLRKALWIGVVVVLPVVGTFIYLLARPFEDPAHVTLRGNERAHTIVTLLSQHASGSMSNEEFSAAKRQVFADAVAAHRARSR